METGHGRSKKIADKHTGKGGRLVGQGSWSLQFLRSSLSVFMSHLQVFDCM